MENLLSVDINVEQLFAQGTNFERRVEQALNNEPSVLDYIHRLESQWDIRVGANLEIQKSDFGDAEGIDDMPNPEEAVQAFEEFLRQNSKNRENNEPTND